MGDPIRSLVHDHGDINQRVRELGPAVRGADAAKLRDLSTPLRDLREHLFLHFAREEEGLFPYVAEALPDLSTEIERMLTAHDSICGALARLIHLASVGGDLATIRSLCGRFEEAYAAHAQSEAALLRDLDARLAADQRSRLGEIVRGL